LRVVLGKQGEIFLNNTPVSKESLTEESKKIVGAKPDVAALLVADKDSTLEMVTEVVDAVKLGGVKKVAFSIQRKTQ
jgi:biopolymer transport protein ExbD